MTPLFIQRNVFLLLANYAKKIIAGVHHHYLLENGFSIDKTILLYWWIVPLSNFHICLLPLWFKKTHQKTSIFFIFCDLRKTAEIF